MRPEPGRRRGADDGAASLVVLALGAALVIIVVLGAGEADLLAARQRAAAAADLGALAGAPAVDGSVTEACGAAAWVVRANGGTLRACDVADGDLHVTVSSAPRGPWVRWFAALLGGVPEPTVSSHAGMR